LMGVRGTHYEKGSGEADARRTEGRKDDDARWVRWTRRREMDA
jgi:hypothetical protein